MRKVAFISLFVGCAIACATAQTKISGKATISGNVSVGPATGGPLTEHLVQAGDITVAGCIYLPTALENSTGDGAGASYDQTTDTVFMGVQSNIGQNVAISKVAQLTLPATIDNCQHPTDPTYALTVIAGPIDPTEGNPDAQTGGADCSGIDMLGLAVWNTTDLYFSKRCRYTTTNWPLGPWRRPKNLSDTGHVAGPYASSLNSVEIDSHRRYTAGLFPIPTEWQTLLQAKMLLAGWFASTFGTATQWPWIGGFDPANFGVDFPQVRYAYTNPVSGVPDNTGQGPFLEVERSTGPIFIPNTRTVLFSMKGGTGISIYGVASDERSHTFAGSGTGTAWNIDIAGGSPYVGNVSTSNDGLTVTVPNATWGGGYPGDWMVCIDGETTPTYYYNGTPPVCATCLTSAWYPGCSETSSGINQGASNAGVIATHAFAHNLTGKTAHLGQPIAFDPVGARGTGGFHAWAPTNRFQLYDARDFYYVLNGLNGKVYNNVAPYATLVNDDCTDPTIGPTGNPATNWLPTTCSYKDGQTQSLIYIPKNAHFTGGPYLIMRGTYSSTSYVVYLLHNIP